MLTVPIGIFNFIEDPELSRGFKIQAIFFKRFRSFVSQTLAREPLFLAAMRKNEAVFSRLLSLKNGLQRKDKELFTALHWSCFSGWVEGVRAALQVRCAYNYLLYASHPKTRTRTDMSALGAQAGVDLNAKSSEGYTPLHIAAFIGCADCAAVLLKAGANLEARTFRGGTPLGMAAQQGLGSKGVLDLLLSHNAAPGIRGYRNRTPLELALIMHGNTDVVKALLEAGADPCRPNPALFLMTPLHIAAGRQHSNAAQELLNAGADPNALAEQGITPAMQLFSAVGESEPRIPRIGGSDIERRRREFLRMLRDSGADFNKRTRNSGRTVLHMAVANCSEAATVDALLDCPGIDPSININSKFSGAENTMLHVCARRGHAQAVARLAAAGAHLTVRNKEGFTPLFLAVLWGRADVVKALVAAGCDPFQRGPDVWPGLNEWRSRRGAQAAEALLNAPGGGALAAAVFDDIQRQLGDGPEITAVDAAVSIVQDIAVVEAFLEVGARPSPEALAKGCMCTPILRTIIERVPWNPDRHSLFPRRFKDAARAMVKSLSRASPHPLPQNVVEHILTQVLYPVSVWADRYWLKKQQITSPQALVATQPGYVPPGPPAGAMPNHHPPFGPMFAGPPFNDMPPFMEHLLAVVQQGIMENIGANFPGGGGAGPAAGGPLNAAHIHHHGVMVFEGPPGMGPDEGMVHVMVAAGPGLPGDMPMPPPGFGVVGFGLPDGVHEDVDSDDDMEVMHVHVHINLDDVPMPQQAQQAAPAEPAVEEPTPVAAVQSPSEEEAGPSRPQRSRKRGGARNGDENTGVGGSENGGGRTTRQRRC